jgi:hypothetical protein
MLSRAELIFMFFYTAPGTTKQNCAGDFKCLDTICSSLFYSAKVCWKLGIAEFKHVRCTFFVHISKSLCTVCVGVLQGGDSFDTGVKRLF